MTTILRILRYCLLEVLSFYCDGAAQKRLRKNVLNPLRMGYAFEQRINALKMSQMFFILGTMVYDEEQDP